MTIIPADPDARPWRSRFAQSHPKSYLCLHGLAGILATMAMLWVFLAIADEIPEGGALLRVDTLVARWLETHGTEMGESVFVWVSYLGGPTLVAVVLAAILLFAWRRDWREVAAVVVTCGGGVVLSTVLKLVFHRGRPETATEFITRQSWSFPSGHAMSSMVSYGFLTVLLLDRITDRRKRIAVAIASLILIGGIGFSRLYLGVHYVSDVTGGWIAGGAWLMVCVSGYRVAQRRHVRGSVSQTTSPTDV